MKAEIGGAILKRILISSKGWRLRDISSELTFLLDFIFLSLGSFSSLSLGADPV
jgi:hypothetical protein